MGKEGPDEYPRSPANPQSAYAINSPKSVSPAVRGLVCKGLNPTSQLVAEVLTELGNESWELAIGDWGLKLPSTVL